MMKSKFNPFLHCKVPLYNREGVVVAHALVDKCHSDLLSLRWHRDNNGYARTSINRETKRRIHTYILEAPEGFMVDHEDGDPLNNTGTNLRLTTRAQNQQNLKARTGCRSEYRGVCFDEHYGKWKARVQVAGKVKSKLFIDEDEAGQWASTKRKELMTHSNETRYAKAG
jgi:hypothetical protein